MYYVRALSQHYSIPVSQSKIPYFFDNEEALRHLNTLSSFSNTTHPLSTDCDIWAALHKVATSTPGAHFGTHVKGHQDGTDLLENLSTEAQLNVRMDEIAGLCRLSYTTPLKTWPHKGNNIVLKINGDIITSNLHSVLQLKKNRAPSPRLHHEETRLGRTNLSHGGLEKFRQISLFSPFCQTGQYNKNVP